MSTTLFIPYKKLAPFERFHESIIEKKEKMKFYIYLFQERKYILLSRELCLDLLYTFCLQEAKNLFALALTISIIIRVFLSHFPMSNSLRILLLVIAFFAVSFLGYYAYTLQARTLTYAIG